MAKNGEVKINEKKIKTPALFPVVDPLQQDITGRELREEFGFHQVITSAYLMSKRIGHSNWEDYPSVHSYLDFDGVVMMDSGAYQVLQYGDIELGVTDTLKLQNAVKPDIGVIMDHPIGHDSTRAAARKKIIKTLENIKLSLPEIKESHVIWTLPLQGGRNLDVLEDYLSNVRKQSYFPNFRFYALGSVVPVMINQDYSSLVKMILKSKEYIPVTYPLHLFGAGHPAMFALAVYLGCDTFDSAAYALMAKDNRYMTVHGTYQLEDLDELLCPCKYCTSYTPKELLNADHQERRKILSAHNLHEAGAEIRRIRNAIKNGSLRDLVEQRSSTVPYLRKATKEALKFLDKGVLEQKLLSGIKASELKTPRISTSQDLSKPILKRIQLRTLNYLGNFEASELTILYFDLKESIFYKFPDNQLSSLILAEGTEILLLTPPFGFLPFGLVEFYPIGQVFHELNSGVFPLEMYSQQLELLKNKKIQMVYLVSITEIPENVLQSLTGTFPNLEISHNSKPVRGLLDHFKRIEGNKRSQK